MTLSLLIQDYINDHELRNSSSHTLKAIRRILGSVSDSNLGATEAKLITTTDLRTYLIGLETTDANKGYHLNWIKALFSWLAEQGHIPFSPASVLKAPKTDNKILDALSDTETKAVIKAAKSVRDQALIRVALETGLRLSELRSMELGSFNADGMAVIMGKGRKERIVAVSKDTLERVWKYEATIGTGPLWKGRDGTPLSDDGLRQAIKSIGTRAGVELTPHKLRRTMAIRRLRAGCDLHTLARMMGHSDINILKQYLPFVEEDMTAAWSKFKVL